MTARAHQNTSDGHEQKQIAGTKKGRKRSSFRPEDVETRLTRISRFFADRA
jgi:hypothetical protein